MAGYGWESYDPRTGGSQIIHDSGNKIDITTEFVKFPEHGEHGGSWGARIRGTPREDASPDSHSTVIFYVGFEGLGNMGVMDFEEGDYEELGFDNGVKIGGETPELGRFTFDIVDRKGNHPSHGHQPAYNAKPLDRTFVHSVLVPEEAMWQAKREPTLSRFSCSTRLIMCPDHSSCIFQLQDHH